MFLEIVSEVCVRQVTFGCDAEAGTDAQLFNGGLSTKPNEPFRREEAKTKTHSILVIMVTV
jgi:hypothetical protein